MVKQAHGPYEQVVPLFPWTAAMNGAAQGAFARTGEVCQRAATAWQQELISFTTERLRKDAEVSRQCIGCRDLDDMAKLQQHWLTSAAEDYAAVMDRMGEIARGFSREIAQATQRSTEEVRSAATAARNVAD